METGEASFSSLGIRPGNIVSNLLRSKLDDDDPESGAFSSDDADSGLLICYEPVELSSAESLMAISFDLLDDFFKSYPSLLNQIMTEVKCQKPKVYKTYLRKCRICQRAFKKQEDLDKHKQLHFEMDRSFKCKTCKKLFFDIRNLKNHEKVHMKENSKCKICLKEFRFEKYLDQHMKQHHDNSQSEEVKSNSEYDSDESDKDEPEVSFSCEVCGKNFSSEEKLTTHTNMHFSYKPFKCRKCPKAFSLEKTFRSHSATHHETNSFTCQLCGKVLLNRAKLNIHIETHHT